MGFLFLQKYIKKGDNKMLKKSIKYVDYNGLEREEDFYFNLSKAEITEMELSVDGGLSGMLERIVKAQDVKEIVKVFKEVIFKAYGEKSSDGKRFVKSKELSEAFSQTEAYNELFMELIMDGDKASEFVKALLPQNLVK